MNIPRLPSRFRQGDRLRASDLNLMLDWMEAVARKLPSLQVTTGPDLNYTRSSSGTVISLARGFAQARPRGITEYEHPFKVTATISEGHLCIYVATGQWCKILSPATANFLNANAGGNNFTLSKADYGHQSSLGVCLYIAAYASAVTYGHCEPADAKVGIHEIAMPSFDVAANGLWTITLATINVDWESETVEVFQKWKSDVSPVWIHPQHSLAPSSGPHAPTE